MVVVASLVFVAALAVFVIGAARRSVLLQRVGPRSPNANLVAIVLGASWLACAAALIAELGA